MSAAKSLQIARCDSDLAIECSNLCSWIYDINTEGKFPEQIKNESLKPLVPTNNHMIEIVHYQLIDFGPHYAVLRTHTKTNEDTIFVVFRGTQSVFDIVNDLAFTLQKIDDWKGNILCHVHGGIYSKMASNFKRIHKNIESHIEKDKSKIKNIVVTGHSLGGGVASLYLLKAFKESLSVYDDLHTLCVTFGSPLVFAKDKTYNQIKNDIFNKLDNKSHHFVNNCDSVPRILGDEKWMNYLLHCIKQIIIENVNDKWNYNYLTKKISYFQSIVPERFTPTFYANSLINFLKQQFDKSGIFKEFNKFNGVGVYYLMDNKKKDIILVTDKSFKSVLYAGIKTESEIKSQDATSLFNDHSMNSYINTLRNNKSNLQSLYINNNQKRMKQLFNKKFHEILITQKSAQMTIDKLTQLINETKKTIKNSIDNRIKKNVHSISELENIWMENKQKLKKQIIAIENTLNNQIKQNKGKMIHVKGDLSKEKANIIKLDAKWNKKQKDVEKLIKSMKKNAEVLNEAIDENKTELISQNTRLEINHNDILDINKKLIFINENKSKLENLIKETNILENEMDKFNNKLMEIKGEWKENMNRIKQSNDIVNDLNKKTKDIIKQNKARNSTHNKMRKSIEQLEIAVKRQSGDLQNQREQIQFLMKLKNEFEKMKDEITEIKTEDKNMIYKIGALVLAAMVIGGIGTIGVQLASKN
eukprot:251011_1